jgi:hypothetical protein
MRLKALVLDDLQHVVVADPEVRQLGEDLPGGVVAAVHGVAAQLATGALPRSAAACGVPRLSSRVSTFASTRLTKNDATERI